MATRTQEEEEGSSLPATKRLCVQGTHGALRGDTYESGNSLKNDSTIATIPDPVVKPSFNAPKGLSAENCALLVYDLETTGFIEYGCYPDITQICVMDAEDETKMFATHVKPDVHIGEVAERITGIRADSDGMFHKGQPVEFKSWETVASELIEWLISYTNNKRIIMIAHNDRRFDSAVLTNALADINLLDKFCSVVSYFCDSLPVLKTKCPKRPSYSLESMVKDFVADDYNAHDAMGDVKALAKLFVKLKVHGNDFISKAYPSTAPYLQRQYIDIRNLNAPSLEILQAEGIVKRPTLERIAGSGLNLFHLELIYQRQGEDGLRNVFSMKNSAGKSRCIERRATLDDVVKKLGAYFSK